MKADPKTIVLHDIVAGLAHNINTPLNLILGYAQQMQKHPQSTAYLQKIIDAGFKIDDLLRTSLDNLNHRTSSSVQDLDIVQLIKDEINQLSNDLNLKRGMLFELSLPSAPIVRRCIPSAILVLIDTMVYQLRSYAPLKISMSIKVEADSPVLHVVFSKEGNNLHVIASELLPSSEDVSKLLSLDKTNEFYELMPDCHEGGLCLKFNEIKL